MSHRAENWAWSLRIPSTDKFVVVALADMADEEDSCYPGHERLADMTGQSVSTVQRSLKRLEQAGLIVRERRHTRAGYRTSDRYYLQTSVQTIETATLPAAAPAASAETEAAPVENSPTGQSAYQAFGGAYRSSSASPTGQGDRAKVNPQGESSGEPSGGAPAMPTCGKHPMGTTERCRACGDARRLWEANRAAEAAAAAAPRAPRYDPAIYCEHLQLRAGDCDACEQEVRTALAADGYSLEVVNA